MRVIKCMHQYDPYHSKKFHTMKQTHIIITDFHLKYLLKSRKPRKTENKLYYFILRFQLGR